MKKVLLSNVTAYCRIILSKIFLNNHRNEGNGLKHFKDGINEEFTTHNQSNIYHAVIKKKLLPVINWRFYSLFTIILITVFSSCSIFSKKTVAKKEVILYPGPPEEPRFQYLTKITTSQDIGALRSGFSKIILGDEKQKIIVKPYGIAIHNGKIYVCDNFGGGMEILDLEKKKFDFFQPGGKGRLKVPINCFVDENGYLYVADVGRYEVVIFDEKGNYVKSFGAKEKFKPSDINVYGDKIYVANIASSCINVYSKDSLNKLLYSIPKDVTSASAALGLPVNIAIYDDKIYVADFGYSEIKTYSLDGNLIDTIGTVGDNPGQFTKLKGIAVDHDYNIYAVDAAFENLQVFNKEGKLLIVLGGHYEGPGDLDMPAKVTIDYDNLKYFQKYVDPEFDLKFLIFVTNQYGPDRITVYGRIERKPVIK